MVAISLYKGNLYRVPFLKDFKSLLTRRSVALSRLRSGLPAAVSSNPKPDFAGNLSNPKIKFEAPENVATDCEAGSSGEKKDGKQSDSAGFTVKSDGESNSPPALKPDLIEEGLDVADVGASSLPVKVEKLDEVENPKSERCNKEDEEVEENLHVLNQKKHNLEELKRRNCMQGVVVRPSVSPQVDVTNDSGSMTRHAAARLGSEANLEMEGVEGDELSNHNFHSHHVFQMNNISPSSDLGPTGTSLSRFAPIRQHGHHANLPTISVLGTNYMVSSPSPAASGDTSAFKDTRLPSSWN
ncbi:unnamed protein product [Malus baccata var. baccata]